MRWLPFGVPVILVLCVALYSSLGETTARARRVDFRSGPEWTRAALDPAAAAGLVRVLAARLRSNDASTRRAALAALRDLRPVRPDAVRAVATLLDTEHALDALGALEEFGPAARPAVRTIVGTLKARNRAAEDGSPWTAADGAFVRAVTRTLANIGGEEVFAEMRRFVFHRDLVLRHVAQTTLSLSGRLDVADAEVRSALRSTDLHVIHAGLWYVKRHARSHPELLETVAQVYYKLLFAEYRSHELRVHAIQALAAYDEAARPTLARMRELARREPGRQKLLQGILARATE